MFTLEDGFVADPEDPNKEDNNSAEVGEGRAWTKENVVRSNTTPTQSGEARVPWIGRCAAGSLPPTIRGKSRMR
jgi:hypothetical protein